MKFNKKSFLKSLYKISTVLFLVGYNFAPSFLAIGQLRDMGGEITPKAAFAASYTLSSTNGIWTAITGGSGLTHSPLYKSEIRWGDPVNTGKRSGLRFDGKGETSFNANEPFLIGDFTHFNWATWAGTQADSATLKVTLNFSNPVISPSPTFSYKFDIEETSNTTKLKDCKYYGTDNQKSQKPCDDIITFPNGGYGEEVYEIGDMKYTLKIDGFTDSYPGGNTLNKFVTEEEKENVAYLVGRLSSVLVEKPAISIVKKVNGQDANTLGEAVEVTAGETVNFTYIVQNTGNVKLTNIAVTDDKGVQVTCPGTELEPGTNMTCTGSATAIAGNYTNIGTVTSSHNLTASDPANYKGIIPTIKICHKTASHKSPYEVIEPDASGDLNGHAGHTGDIWFPGITVEWGDIIPPFTSYDGVYFKGLNWSEYGQAVYNNNCVIPQGQITVKKVLSPASNDNTEFTITGSGTPSINGSPTFLYEANSNIGKIRTNKSHTYNVMPGTYNIEETLPEGWSLVSNTCSNIEITNNETKECTITNTQDGSLTVVKEAIPHGTDKFYFTVTGDHNTNKRFHLVDNSGTENASKTLSLKAGKYAVAEDDYSVNWNTVSSCKKGNETIDKNNIVLGAGENVVCTFTNTKYGSISGHKYHDLDGLASTTNDRKPVYGYTIFIDTNKDGILDPGEKSTTTAIDGSYSFTGLEPGEYTIAEVMKIGWIVLPGTSTAWTIKLSAGEDKKNVDFINIEKPTIKIIKFVDTDGDGKVDVEYAKDWTWKLDDKEYKMFGKEEKPMEIMPGTYTISEIQKDGYHVKSMMCDNGGVKIFEKPIESAKLTINSGDKILCRFTNTRDTGTLIVRKEVVNDNGGKLVAEDFSFQIGEGKLIGFKPVSGNPLLAENIFVNFPTGTYSITEKEANTRGYATTYDNCEKIVVKKGEKAVCTIKNDDIAPELTVIKNVINEGNDGTKKAEDFEITVHGKKVSTPTFDGSENGVTVTLNVGEYKVTEKEDTENYKAEYSKDCSGTINIGEKKTCTITNTGIDHLPSIVVTKDADKTAVNETGEDVTFTFTVKNTSKVDTVTILSLVDSKFGTLAGDDDCKVGTELVPGASCSFTLTKTIKGDAIGPDHENIFKATVKDEEGNETSDEDNHIIEFNDVLPTVEVTKEADKTSVDETGENVTFTFTVKNTSDENVTIATLTDSVFGTLVGDTDCKVGTELVPDASCTFTLTKLIKGDASGPDHENTFKAEVTDNEGNTAADTDTETIGFDDVLPTVEVTKEADKTSVDETGESVTFTFTVKNTSEENVTITTLTDSVFGALAGDDDCKVGTELAAGASCTFTLTKTIDGNASGPDHENVFTAVVTDNDGSTGEDTDNEIITFKDVEPSIEVTKTAGVTEIPETGGKVTFTYEVTNDGLEEVEITYLNDDQFGDLDGDEDCKIGTKLGAGESCTFAEEFEIPANEPGDPDAPTTHKNIFTAKAKDDEENEVGDEDTEEVKLTPVPSLKLVKNVVHKYNSDTNITAADWTLYATGDGGFNYAGDTDEFRFVKAGVPYTLSEEGIYSPQFEASDWTCTGGELTGSTLTLAAEDDIVCTITNTALPAAVKVYKDVLDGFSKDIFKVQLEDGGEVQDISDTEDANKRLVAEFTGLDAGTYNPEEVELPDGYIAQGCVPVEGYSATVRNGEETEFVCVNKVIDPILQIEKSNDAVVALSAGDEVTYTITVTAPDDKAEGTYVLNNVVVSDIAPAGFEYMLGSWTVEKNSVDITGEVPEPTYDGENAAQWMIGGMKEGDVVVLTYQTKISLLQDPGNYPDIAWVAGTSLIDGAVLGASVVDPLTPFVGTNVTITEPVETEEGEVLGASITLPVTGASTYLTLGALIMMILGAITLLLKPFKKLSYALLTGLMAISFVTLLTPNRVLALDSDIKVRIMQPATPTNKSSFNVGFVALDLNNNSITVECYKDAEVAPFATFTANTGNCPVTVSASGTYTFYVVAKSTSGEQKSADVTVVVDLEKPAPVIDYSKAGNVIKFKTPNDPKIKTVEIHRSDKPSYTANESTRIHPMPVSPNTEYSWTDTTAEAGKTYYYALRTVDAIGNTSTIVSDPEVVEVPAATTNTRTGDVAGQTDTKKEGEVAGETDDITEGEDTEVKKTEEGKEKVDIKETGKNILSKWYFWVIVVVVIGGIAFYVKKQKSN